MGSCVSHNSKDRIAISTIINMSTPTTTEVKAATATTIPSTYRAIQIIARGQLKVNTTLSLTSHSCYHCHSICLTYSNKTDECVTNANTKIQ
jgi:hypothetical protein